MDAASYDCADAANQACVAKDEGMSLLQLRDSFHAKLIAQTLFPGMLPAPIGRSVGSGPKEYQGA